MSRSLERHMANLATLINGRFEAVLNPSSERVTIFYVVGYMRYPVANYALQEIGDLTAPELCIPILEGLAPRIQTVLQQRIRELKGDTQAPL